MRKSIIIFFIALIAVSCGNSSQDINTVDGAANILCDLMDQIVVAANSGDKARLRELNEKAVEYDKQIQKAIEEGKYTENELERILIDRNCDF